MDIGSKKYRIRSANFGASIEHKPSGRLRFIGAAAVPSVRELAMMHESAFDQLMAAFVT